MTYVIACSGYCGDEEHYLAGDADDYTLSYGYEIIVAEFAEREAAFAFADELNALIGY